MDAVDGGVLRRNRAVPAPVGELLSLEGIETAADLLRSEKVGSSKSCFGRNFTTRRSLLTVLVASKQAVVL